MKIDSMAINTSKPHQLRLLSSEVGILSQPDGSANLYHGDTSILAAVYGPTQVRINKEKIDKATVEVLYKAKVGLPSCNDKFQQDFIRNTCETAIITSLHPRTAINIIIQEMHNSGSLLACSINAAFLALLDACVPLQFTVVAVCCAIDTEGEITLDPKLNQEKTASAIMTFAFDSKDKNLIMSNTSGIYTKEKYQICLALCREASAQIFCSYREAITKKISKSLTC